MNKNTTLPYTAKARNIYLDNELGFGKYFDKTLDWVIKHDKSYWSWLQTIQHNFILEIEPEPIETEDDKGWRSVDPKVLRLWAAGYYVMKQPANTNHLINFSTALT